MATRMTSPLAGIGWLRDAVNVGGRKPWTLLGAAGLMFLVSMLPSLATMPIQYAMPGNMGAFLGAMAFALILGLFLSPVFGGYLQVIDKIEGGREARVRDVFAPYRDGTAKPIILFAALLLVVYLAAAAVVILSAGAEIRGLYADMLSGTMPPPQAQPPRGFWRAWTIGLLLWPLIAGLWSIGYGQIAIARRPVGEAFMDGVTGTLKNVLPILLLLVMLFVCLLAVGLAFVVLAVVLNLAGKLVGDWLSVILVLPVYAGFLLGLYVVLFGLAYFFWRDVCVRYQA